MDNFVPRHAAFIAIQIYLLECKLVLHPSHTLAHTTMPLLSLVKRLPQPDHQKTVYEAHALQPIGVKDGTVGLKKSELQ